MNGRSPTDALVPGQVSGDPEVAAAEARIVEDRARVTRSMLALRREVKRRLDWRAWAKERPLAVIGAALALGVLLGWRSREHRRR